MPTLTEILAAHRGLNAPILQPVRTTLVSEESVRGGVFAAKRAEAPGITDDLERIQNLPRRPFPTDAELDGYVRKWNSTLGISDAERGLCTCAKDFPNGCIKSLMPLQAWTLEEYSTTGGALGKLAVGGGKTGLDILLGMVRPGVKRIMLLLKAHLVDQFLDVDYRQWRRHFRVPNLDGRYAHESVPGRPTLFVYSHTDIQTPRNTGLLESLKPDLIIIDESQAFANPKSSRTIRLNRFFQKHPETEFVALSGSMNTKSINDYAHHALLALREQSPLPADPSTLRNWAKVIDPNVNDTLRAPAGSLRLFCEGVESVEEGIGRRVRETKGVVVSAESSCSLPLYMHTRRPPPMPEELREPFRILHVEKTRPDGEEPDTPFRLAQWGRQMACGFYYHWRFPKGESEDLISEWFERRAAWNKDVRTCMELNPEEGMDSPRLLENAAQRYHARYKGPLPVWASPTYLPWKEIEPKVQPVTAFRWLSNHLLDDATAWAVEQKAAGRGGIVWCEFSEFGQRLASRLGVSYYNGGDENAAALRAETGSRVVVCSIKGHGTGTNLQRFRHHLVTGVPADAGAWEQLLGRSHRHGQTEAVHYTVYQHTNELRGAMEKAMEKAAWIFKMDKCDQKLLLAQRD